MRHTSPLCTCCHFYEQMRCFEMKKLCYYLLLLLFLFMMFGIKIEHKVYSLFQWSWFPKAFNRMSHGLADNILFLSQRYQTTEAVTEASTTSYCILPINKLQCSMLSSAVISLPLFHHHFSHSWLLLSPVSLPQRMWLHYCNNHFPPPPLDCLSGFITTCLPNCMSCHLLF